MPFGLELRKAKKYAENLGINLNDKLRRKNLRTPILYANDCIAANKQSGCSYSYPVKGENKKNFFSVKLTARSIEVVEYSNKIIKGITRERIRTGWW